MTAKFPYNPHPGGILVEEFMNPLALSQRDLARALNVDPMRINEISGSPARSGSRSGPTA